MPQRATKSEGKILLIDAPAGVSITPLIDEFKKHGWVGWDLLGLDDLMIDERYREFPVIASVHHISEVIAQTDPSINVVLGRYWPYALALLRTKGVQGAGLENLGEIARETQYVRLIPDSTWRPEAAELKAFAKHHLDVSSAIAPAHLSVGIEAGDTGRAMQWILSQI